MKRKNVQMVRGDSFVFDVFVKDIENVTVESLYFSVRKTYEDAAYVLQKSLGSGITEYKPLKFRVRVAPEDTAGLEPGSFVYDLQIGFGGDIYTVLGGEFDLLPDVTKEV